MWILLICSEIGTINEIYVPYGCGKVVSKMMNCLDQVGYKWKNTVDGNTKFAYTLERRYD